MTELRLGREQAGIDHLLAAYGLLSKIRPYIRKTKVNETIFELGVGYMRLGETQNCALQHNAESCILPSVEGESIRCGRVPPRRPNTSLRFWKTPLRKLSSATTSPARWLLNIAHMTLDQYPDQVPERYRIPPSTSNPRSRFRAFATWP